MENIIVIEADAIANIQYDFLQHMYKSVAKYPHLPAWYKAHAIFVLTKYL